MSETTPPTTTHASGPRAGQPLVAGRCPTCGGSLYLTGGHVTCSRSDCPAPEAADDMLHGGPWQVFPLRRREWAAALRWAADKAAEPFGGAQDGDLDSTDLRQLADQIEVGAFTPWADQPEPAVGEPDVGQVTLEDLPEDVAERAVSLAMVGDRDGMMRALREGVDRARVDQPEPATDRCGTCQLPIRWTGDRWVHEADGSDDFDPPHPAQPSGAAPAAAGPHPDTPDRPAGAELDLDAIQARAAEQRHCGHCDMPLERAERVCINCGKDTPDDVGDLLAEVRRLRAQALDPQAGLDREADAPSEPAGSLGPGILGRAQLDASGDLWRERPPLTPIAPPRWSHGTRLAPSREWLDSRYGPVTEVLLVSPAAGRVLTALREWRLLTRAGAHPGAAGRWLSAAADAIDALDGDQPAELGKHPSSGPENRTYQDSGESSPSLTPEPDDAASPGASGSTPAAEPAPEPDSGAGWNLVAVEGLIRWLTEESTWPPHMDPAAIGRQLRALLADRDRLAAEVDAGWQAAGDMAAIEQQAAADRAETARVRAALAAERRRADRAETTLATARRDAAADALEEAANDASVLLESGARAFTAIGLRRRAEITRAGTRATPGSSQSADGGGDDG